MSKDILFHLASNSKNIKKKDLLYESLELIVKELVGKADRFEESDAIFWSDLATIYEKNEDWLSAAQTLEPVKFNTWKVLPLEQIKFYIWVAQYWIEADESGRAEPHLAKIHNLGKKIAWAEGQKDITWFEEMNLEDLTDYKFCQVKVNDSRRQFLRASMGYYDISLSALDIIEESSKID